MAEHYEARHERLYLKEPRSDRLRKGAAGRLRYLLASGWREVERWDTEEYVTVKIERSGHAPRMTVLPKPPPQLPRPPRSGFGQGRGGPGGRGPGGGPAPGGGPRR